MQYKRPGSHPYTEVHILLTEILFTIYERVRTLWPHSQALPPLAT